MYMKKPGWEGASYFRVLLNPSKETSLRLSNMTDDTPYNHMQIKKKVMYLIDKSWVYLVF